MGKKLSIIFVHYSTDNYKSRVGETNLKRLIATLDDTVELIVVNNGERDQHFKNFSSIYIKADGNCLGRARNLGYDISSGEFLCFIDNDIEVDYGWWQECIRLLEKYPDRKFIASPVHSACHVNNKRLSRGEIDGNPLNLRAGSPCLVMQRKSFEEIGRFKEIPNAPKYPGKIGGDFLKRQIALNYLMILSLTPMARHISPKGIYAY